MLRDDLTDPTIGAFYDVYNQLGHGFLESVYEPAMVIALRKRGLVVERQAPVVVYYDGEAVGKFFADLMIEQAVIVELKSCRALAPAREAQVLNYLRATSIEVGLILHFAPKPSVCRLILTNDRKPYFHRRRVPRASVVTHARSSL